MHHPITGAWAKQHPREQPSAWLPLLDHSHDVAAVFEQLISLEAISRHLSRLAGRPALCSATRARLAVLAFLHDVGKANAGFFGRKNGHIKEAVIAFADPAIRNKTGLERLAVFFSPADEADWIAALLAHHGEPPDLQAGCDLIFTKLWQPAGEYYPQEEAAFLVQQALQSWPEAFAPNAPPLPSSPAFRHAFLGILQLGDWIGSDSAADAFPFSGSADNDRRAFSAERAAKLLYSMGISRSPAASLSLRGTFTDLFDFPPTPIQTAVAEAKGPIVVMEAETGSGKTEGALFRFARLYEQGKVDGLYFALPTRVAATQMYERVMQAVKRFFPNAENRPSVIRALPGDASADGQLFRKLPEFDVEWYDDPEEAIRRRRWAAESPKRFLAAPIAVGTIDQALLGAVRVRHAHMRSICLTRSLLVVDEVHASDLYMTGLLENLLRQHVRGGGEALLLSATLGAATRTHLMLAPKGNSRVAALHVPVIDEARRQPYPAVATLGENGPVLAASPSRGSQKQVIVEPDHNISEPEIVAAFALGAAHAGARVLVIRNTVRDAITTREALEALAPRDPVQFTLHGAPTLHHGRFAKEDRRLLDRAVEERFGKRARAGGLVGVGTQTLEISLDIDADLLITDLAPVDVLLQRIGRLHRHERERPAGFAKARCTVLSPVDFSAALANKGRGPHGHGTVYRNLVALEATRRLIGNGREWIIPDMNRKLVEAVVHPRAADDLADELGVSDSRWLQASFDTFGRQSAMRNAAESALLRWDKNVVCFQIEERAATRLGTRDVMVEFPAPLPGPFGTAVEILTIPDHLNPSQAFEPFGIFESAGGFTFRLGERQFVYDSLGLRRTN
jgi:CRISPR-associated endonuclease/helicase Cas3